MTDLNWTQDWYILAIALLLPIMGGVLMGQKNPYHALVLRGILGAIAALFYAICGAADVALTEALVGTMLSITLYAIAVRSSMNLRLGILEPDLPLLKPSSPFFPCLKPVLDEYHLRLEPVGYPTPEALAIALQEKEIHGTVQVQGEQYHLTFRIPRLYELFKAKSLPETVTLMAIANDSPQISMSPLTEP